MASIRGKIRDRTDRRYAGLPLERAVENVNRVVRGWGNYFRYGNSAAKFTQIDSYVSERLAILASNKHGLSGRNWATRFNYEWVNQLGTYRLTGTVKSTTAYASRRTMSESRVRENRMHGSMRRREATNASRCQHAPCGHGSLPPTLPGASSCSWWKGAASQGPTPAFAARPRRACRPRPLTRPLGDDGEQAAEREDEQALADARGAVGSRSGRMPSA
jgi:hypothetical protein